MNYLRCEMSEKMTKQGVLSGLLFLMILYMCGCNVIPELKKPTHTATPSPTTTPNFTLTPTRTLIPTLTKTSTPTITQTPTPTPTPTMSPSERAAIALWIGQKIIILSGDDYEKIGEYSVGPGEIKQIEWLPSGELIYLLWAKYDNSRIVKGFLCKINLNNSKIVCQEPTGAIGPWFGFYYLFTVSPNGKHVAIGDFENIVIYKDIFSSEQRIFKVNGVTPKWSWSPESDRLVWSYVDPAKDPTSYLKIFDIKNNKEMDLKRKIKGEKPIWAPAGNEIVYVNNDQFYKLSLETMRISFLSGASSGTDPYFSPDGNLISTTIGSLYNGKLAISIIDGNTGRPFSTKINFKTTGILKWSPDSNKLVFIKTPDKYESCLLTLLYVYAINGEDLIPLFDRINSFSNISTFSWSPDSNKIIFAGYSDDLSELNINLINADGTNINILTSVPNTSQYCDMSSGVTWRKNNYVSTP